MRRPASINPVCLIPCLLKKLIGSLLMRITLISDCWALASVSVNEREISLNESYRV